MPKTSQRLRAIGILVLVGGLSGTGLTYWLRMRNAEPSIEDVIPGTAEAEERQMQIMYGQTGAAFFELLHDLTRPNATAVEMSLASVIGGVACMRAAGRREKDESSTS